MRLHALETRLAELPYRPLTSSAGGQLLHELALEADIEDVLELGFAHGTSTG